MNTDEWVVYRVTQDNLKTALGCETRADWDEWERRYKSGHEVFPEGERVELLAAGLTETVAREMVHMSREMR
jgi:hypothetical protein